MNLQQEHSVPTTTILKSQQELSIPTAILSSRRKLSNATTKSSEAARETFGHDNDSLETFK